MFGDIGVPELLIILAIVVLLFGVGKLGRLGKDLGTSVKEFRRAVSDEPGEPPAANPVAVQPAFIPAPLPAPEHVAVASTQPASERTDQAPPQIF